MSVELELKDNELGLESIERQGAYLNLYFEENVILPNAVWVIIDGFEKLYVPVDICSA